MNDYILKDRKEAGKKLAGLLLKYRNEDAVVYGLPRGGAVVAKEIAKKLKKPLDLIIVRKIGYPGNPEFAIGAVTEKGKVILNESLVSNIEREWIEDAILLEQREAKRRRKVYLGNRPAVETAGKIVIIVDDGMATGFTMLAAIEEIKRKSPKKIIAAVPIAPKDTEKLIQGKADEVIVLEAPEFFMGSIGAYYKSFEQTSDEEVIEIMERSFF